MNILSQGFSFLKPFFFQWAPAHVSGLPALSENAFLPGGRKLVNFSKPWEEWGFLPAKRCRPPGQSPNVSEEELSQEGTGRDMPSLPTFCKGDPDQSRSSRACCKRFPTNAWRRRQEGKAAFLVSDKILKLGSTWFPNVCAISKSGSRDSSFEGPGAVRWIIPYLESFCIIKEKCFLPLSRKMRRAFRREKSNLIIIKQRLTAVGNHPLH